MSGHVVADYFMVGVPFAKSLDPVTKKNWEGTGVEPDVKVPAADALATAEKLAIEKIQTKTRRPIRLEASRAQSRIRKVRQPFAPVPCL